MQATGSEQVELSALNQELLRRQGTMRGAVGLVVAVTGPLVAVLLDGSVTNGAGHEAEAAVLTCFVLLTAWAALILCAVHGRQVRYLKAALRLFAAAGGKPTLTEQVRDSRWAPATALGGELSLLAAVCVTCAVGSAVVYLAVRDHSTFPVLAVLALSGAATAQWIGVLRQSGWLTPVEQLADGIRALRDLNHHEYAAAGSLALRRTGNDDDLRLLVRGGIGLPNPAVSADAFFGREGWAISATNGQWVTYQRKPSSPVDALGDAEEVATAAALAAPSSTAQRWGPVAAAALGALSALLLVVSLLAGPPDPLPGWALESPLLFASARAALGILGLVLLANMLMALAGGRLVAKFSDKGLELDPAAASTEVAAADRTASEALDKTRASVVNVRRVLLEFVLPKLEELEASGKADDNAVENESRTPGLQPPENESN